MLPPMEDLLARAGFTLRRRNRATCAWCYGHDPATASYTENFVHCFRCGRTQGYISLARELNLLTKDLSTQDRSDLKRKQEEEKRRLAFIAWQQGKLKIITYKLARLNYYARLAREVLRTFPEEELAWSALGNLAHSEARLFAAFDFFAMTKVSDWLEQESTPAQLVALFNESIRGSKQGA